MSGKWTKDFRFIAAAATADGFVVAMTSNEAAEDMEDLTIVATWREQEWQMLDKPYLWSVVDGLSITAPKPVAIFLGTWGEILFTNGRNSNEESIETATFNQPTNRGPMCGLCVVEDTLYAVGMGRQVYQRASNGRWLCLDDPIRPTTDDDNIVGLYSIDGFSREEIYTVGLNGEIWWYDSGRWVQVDSPTNMPLCRVFCDGDDRAYVCGRNGTILAGRRDRWSLIAQDDTDDDLWSIARYRGQLFFLGTHCLYSLENNELIPVPITGASIGFCQRLAVDKNRLWLVGPKDLLVFDGNRWIRVD